MHGGDGFQKFLSNFYALKFKIIRNSEGKGRESIIIDHDELRFYLILIRIQTTILITTMSHTAESLCRASYQDLGTRKC